MGNKKQDLGEFDFDNFDSFGFDDGDFGVENPKDDRKPVTRATGIAISAGKYLATDKQFIRDAIRGALPKGYSDAFDVASEGVENARSLYNEARGEIAPGIRDFKKATKALLPKIETILPKKLAETLKNWSDDSFDANYASQQQMDQDEMQGNLTGIFEAKAEQDEAIANQESAERLILDRKAENRSKNETTLLTGIQEYTAKLVGYQDQVLAKYQRKSLELQYLSYFSQRDLLSTVRESNQAIVKNLVDITKNTSLPDYLKINLTEDAKRFMRERAFGRVMDSSGFGEWSGGFVERIMGRLRGKLKEGANTFNEAASGAYQAASQADLLDGLSEAEKERLKDEGLASGAASILSFGGLGAKLGGLAGKHLKDNKGVKDLGSKLGFLANNWRTMATDFADTQTEWDNPFSFLVDDIKSGIGGFGGLKTHINQTSMVDDHKPSPFDGRSHRSLTEIIPGLLSRILQSTEGIRTGEEVDQVVYNYDRGEFTTRKRAAKDAAHNIVGKHREVFNRQIDELMNNIDEGEELSGPARALLRTTLVQDIAKPGGGFSPKRYSLVSKYKGAEPEVAKELANHISSFYGVANETDEGTNGYDAFGDDEGVISGTKRRIKNVVSSIGRDLEGTQEELNRRQRDSKMYEEIRAYAPGLGKSLSSYANAGQREILRDLGLLKKEGTADVVDEDFLWRYLSETGSELLTGSDEENNEKRTKSNRASRTPRARPARRSFGFDDFTGVRATPPVVQSVQQTVDPEVLRGVIEPETDRLIEALQQINPVERLDEVSQILAQLLLIVDNIGRGLPGEGGGAGPTSAAAGKRSWWDVRRLGSAGVSAGTWMAKKYAALTFAPLRWAKKGAEKLWGGISGATKWARNKTKSYAFDVYVVGEREPALTRKGMLAGDYLDVLSKKVVKSFKDITGPVIEISTGNYVLTEEDFEKGLRNAVGDEVKVRGKKLMSWLWDKAGKGASLYKKLTFAPLVMAKNAIKTAWKTQRDWFDVYVEGEVTPRILAWKLRAGEYRSALTGKVIKTLKDIDGDVIDAEGNVVLTKDDLKKGLRDKLGRPIRSLLRRGLGKLTEWTGKAAKFGLRTARRGLELGGKLLASPFKALGALGRGIKNAWESSSFEINFNKSTKEQTQILEAIHDLLDERLANRKTSKFDASGDGLRDGSWQALKKERAEKAAADAAAKKGEGKEGEPKEKPTSLWGKLLFLLGGAGATLKAMKDKLFGIGDILKGGFTKLLEAFAQRKAIEAGADLAGDLLGGDGPDGKGKRGPRGKGGLLRRGANLLKRGGAALGRGALWAYGALGGGSMVASGAATAATSATAATAAATAGTAATAASTAAAGAGAATGGAAAASAGLFSNPIGWGIVGAVALAYGGYKLYRYLKERLKDLGYLRMAQYGFMERDESSIDNVRKLEAQLEDYVKVSNGKPEFDSNIPWQDIMAEVGVDTNTPEAIPKFANWLKNRFMPVYVAHRIAIAKYDPSESILTEDSVDDKVKADIAKEVMAKVPPVVFDISTHPFGGSQPLTDTRAEVRRRAELLGQFGGSKGENARQYLATETVGNSVIGPDGSVRSQFTTSEEVKNRKTVRAPTDVIMIDEATADKKREESIKAGNFVWTNDNTKTIDPLGSVRMRAYGLVDLEVSDVSLLTGLEQAVWKEIKVGWFGGTNIDADPNQYYDKYAAAFGCTIGNEEQRGKWTYWFKNRFLPVVLTIHEAFRRVSDKVNIENAWRVLTPEDQLKVAQAIMSATASVSGRDFAIWAVDASPFPGKPANMDSSSCDVALASLKEKIRTKKVLEDRARQAKNDGSSIVEQQQRAMNAGGYGAMRPGSTLGMMGGATGYGTNGTGPQMGSTNPQDANYVPPEGYDHPGAGTGGDINALPTPKGDGFNNIWPLLQAVAEMVGVDPKLLATMCAVESDFKISAKAGTSSAGGLFQFINSTWKAMLKKYGSKYGIAPNTSKNDPRANALLGAEYIRENYEYLAKSIGRKPNANDLYMAHFLGPGGAKQVLTGQPDAIAASLNPKAAAANKSVFYHNKGNGAPRTVRELMAEIDRRMTGKTSAYDIASAEMTNTGKTVEVKETPIDPTMAAAPAPVSDADIAETDAKGGIPQVSAIPTSAPPMASPTTPTTPTAPSAPANMPSPMSPTPTVAPTVNQNNVGTNTKAVVEDAQRAADAQAAVNRQRRAQQDERERELSERNLAIQDMTKQQLEKLTSIDATLSKILDATMALGEARKQGKVEGKTSSKGNPELKPDTRKSPISVGLGS